MKKKIITGGETGGAFDEKFEGEPAREYCDSEMGLFGVVVVGGVSVVVGGVGVGVGVGVTFVFASYEGG